MYTIAENIKYKFSNDPAILEQYFEIREICYRTELGLTEFSGARDEFDIDGYIATAIKNGKCIGGARLIVSTPSMRRLIHLETPEHKMVDLLPHLNLDKHSYCEFGRLAIQKEERQGGKIFHNLLSLLIEKSRKQQIKFLLFESETRLEVLYDKAFREYNIYICRQPFKLTYLEQYKSLDLNFYVAEL